MASYGAEMAGAECVVRPTPNEDIAEWGRTDEMDYSGRRQQSRHAASLQQQSRLFTTRDEKGRSEKGAFIAFNGCMQFRGVITHQQRGDAFQLAAT